MDKPEDTGPAADIADEKGQKSAYSRILGNTSVLIVGRILNAVCSFAFIPWTVRTIGLDSFGVMMLIITYVMLVSDLTQLQSWQSLLHYGSSYFRNREQRGFYTILAFCIRVDVMSSIVALLVGLAGIFLFGSLMGWSHDVCVIAAWSMPTLLFMNTDWSLGIMRLMGRFKMSTTVEFAGTAVRTIATYIGYKMHYGLGFFLFSWSLSLFLVFAACTGVAALLIRDQVASPFPWRLLFMPGERIPGIWKFTFGTSFSQILESFFRQISTLMVGTWLGTADAAIYRVGNQITKAMVKPAVMMIPAIYPEFVKLRDERNWDGLGQVVRRLLKTICLFSVLVVVVAFLIGGHVLDFMLHKHIDDGHVLTSILALSAMLDIAQIPFEPFLTVMRKIRYLLVVKIIATTACIPALFFLMRLAGINGAALTNAVAYGIIFALYLIKTHSVLQQTRREAASD
ncbi:oligosaccharide flippase family protein [Acetobacter sp. AN02]|uniref:lipopolysaccharide biosynthesis protein n=1 Tax=Acetobacter sp. AN02 TaxID=2894186 RepID=UPI002434535C|nr:oligosaccharide flippase family protein [Acetobacter sp. AN02]MDG6095472.1 oligosaccharide flippase family protein [Acetobacter sp. AN02]